MLWFIRVFTLLTPAADWPASLCIRVYSEEQPGDAATALFIKKLDEEDAGEYRCTAVYASNQQLEARVDISVYSE